MRTLGEQPHSVHSLGVPLPGVQQILGDEALVWRVFGAQVDAHVLRHVQERAALVVVRLLDVQLGPLLHRLVVRLLTLLLPLGDNDVELCLFLL